jgi:hypothetical protein
MSAHAIGWGTADLPRARRPARDQRRGRAAPGATCALDETVRERRAHARPAARHCEIKRCPDGAPDVRPDASLTNDGNAALAHALEAILRPCKRTAKALKQDLAVARADLASEQARTTRAIAAFEALARRLEAMAAQHAIKP